MKKIFLFLSFIFLCFPILALGQTSSASPAKANIIFRARVTRVIEQKKNTLPDGSQVEQQNLELIGEEGEFKDKKIIFRGIGNYDVIKKNIYKVGDEVLVVASFDDKGNPTFFVTDYVRQNALKWLALVFVAVLLLVGRLKGLRSLLALCLTFLIIVKYIIPRILEGQDPIIITLIGSFAVLLAIIYITEGFNKRSHIAVVSILISLILTITISWIFVEAAKLTGVFNEETGFLINLGGQLINFKGLLLAAIIIGTLGVLDDVIISQVATVEELYKADSRQTRRQLFTRAYRVGVSHISSMTNTLFLAYAGAALPLLILFVSGQSAFTSFSQALNNEAIATEIVRTLAGSLGLILSVPLSTFVAVWAYKKR